MVLRSGGDEVGLDPPQKLVEIRSTHFNVVVLEDGGAWGITEGKKKNKKTALLVVLEVRFEEHRKRNQIKKEVKTPIFVIFCG